jgi:hypothetical protein
MSARQPDYTVKAQTNRKDGEDKVILMTVGAAWNFSTSGGGISLVINALPVPFNGKLALFPAKDDDH